MNWYEWNSRADFNTWHEALCLTLGYPQISQNQATGLDDAAAQKTTSYTLAFEVEGKWIAKIDEQYADGLTITQLRRPAPIQD